MKVPMPALTVEQIAKGLSDAQRTCLCDTDPDRLESATSTLIALALSCLANVRPDNTVFLTPLGLSVKTYLEKNDE